MSSDTRRLPVLRLPAAPAGYSKDEQDQVRRMIEVHYHPEANAHTTASESNATTAPYIQCVTSIVDSDDTTCTVQVDAVLPTGSVGSPLVALITTSAPATIATRPGGAPNDGDFVASGSQWVFDLGDFSTWGIGQARFRARCTGFQDDDDLIELVSSSAAPSLTISTQTTDQDLTSVTTRVLALDSYPQLTVATPLRLTVLAINNTNGVFVGASAVHVGDSYQLQHGDIRDFVIFRPAFGDGQGSVTFDLTSDVARRTRDRELVLVAEQNRDTVPIRLEFVKLAYDTGASTYRVYFKAWTKDIDGVETESHLAGFWVNNYSLGSTITDIATGTTASGINSTTGLGSHYTIGSDPWYIEWSSSQTQAWQFHIVVGPAVGVDWTGYGVSSPISGQSMNLTVPRYSGGSGTAWYTGIGAPSGATGADGDFYLRSSNGDYYQKASGSWGSPIASLKGTAGTNGTNVTNGSAGAAATIAVGSTTTGVAGSAASVTNSGSSSAATFNFTIPRGATGADGAVGPNYPVRISTSPASGAGVLGELWIQYLA